MSFSPNRFLPNRLPPSVRALGHPLFRAYFFAQAVSILGSWVQQVALAWLVYRLTHSSALLGVTAFCALIPQLLVGPFAGAWIDKHDKRKWAIGTQSLMSLQAVVLSVLTLSGLIGPGLIIAMSLTLGVLTSFDTPLRQSLISSFIKGERADLANALALNAMVFNLGRFIGPPVAGLLLGLTTEGVCFGLNALSYLWLIAVLVASPPPGAPRARGNVGAVFKEGVLFAWRNIPVRVQIATLMMVNITASCYAVLLPILAGDRFGGDASLLGWLWGAAGSGALAGAILLATHGEIALRYGTVIIAATISALAALGLAVAPGPWTAMLALCALGFGITTCNVGTNIILQSSTPDQYRGRVVSFFTSSRFGFDALGGLLAGLVAAEFGVARTLAAEGAVLVVYCLALLLRRRGLEDALAAQRAKI